MHADLSHFLTRLGELIDEKVVLVDVGVNKGVVLFAMLGAFATTASVRAADLSATNVALVRALLRSGCNATVRGPHSEFAFVGGFAAHCARAERARALLAARRLERAWRVEELALSYRNGETRVCPTLAGWEHGHLGGAAKFYGDRQPRARSQGACRRVSVDSLDEWLGHELRTHGRRAVVKVDAEGFDGPVVRGATRLLRERRVVALLFECCHLWDRAVAAGALPPNPFGALAASGAAAWTNRSASHVRSLAIASNHWGYTLFALGARPNQLLQEISPRLQRTDEELAVYTRGRWGNFVLLDSWMGVWF